MTVLVEIPKKTGQSDCSEIFSVSDIESSGLAGFFRYIWSNLCTRLIRERLTRRGLMIGQIYRVTGNLQGRLRRWRGTVQIKSRGAELCLTSPCAAAAARAKSVRHRQALQNWTALNTGFATPFNV